MYVDLISRIALRKIIQNLNDHNDHISGPDGAQSALLQGFRGPVLAAPPFVGLRTCAQCLWDDRAKILTKRVL